MLGLDRPSCLTFRGNSRCPIPVVKEPDNKSYAIRISRPSTVGPVFDSEPHRLGGLCSRRLVVVCKSACEVVIRRSIGCRCPLIPDFKYSNMSVLLSTNEKFRWRDVTGCSGFRSALYVLTRKGTIPSNAGNEKRSAAKKHAAAVGPAVRGLGGQLDTASSPPKTSHKSSSLTATTTLLTDSAFEGAVSHQRLASSSAMTFAASVKPICHFTHHGTSALSEMFADRRICDTLRPATRFLP